MLFNAGNAARGACDERRAVFSLGGFVGELAFFGCSVDEQVFRAVNAVYHLIIGVFVIGEGAHGVSRHKIVFDGEPERVAVCVNSHNSDEGILICTYHEFNGVAGVERVGKAVFAVEHGGGDLHGAVFLFRSG